VSVTSSGCLGPCFDGPTIVVYPEGTWYAGVKEEDVAEIVEKHMVGGQVVERLVYRWPES
jgi:(2Fe-2S) ferredoxin